MDRHPKEPASFPSFARVPSVACGVALASETQRRDYLGFGQHFFTKLGNYVFETFRSLGPDATKVDRWEWRDAALTPSDEKRKLRGNASVSLDKRKLKYLDSLGDRGEYLFPIPYGGLALLNASAFGALVAVHDKHKKNYSIFNWQVGERKPVFIDERSESDKSSTYVFPPIQGSGDAENSRCILADEAGVAVLDRRRHKIEDLRDSGQRNAFNFFITNDGVVHEVKAANSKTVRIQRWLPGLPVDKHLGFLKF